MTHEISITPEDAAKLAHSLSLLKINRSLAALRKHLPGRINEKKLASTKMGLVRAFRELKGHNINLTTLECGLVAWICDRRLICWAARASIERALSAPSRDAEDEPPDPEVVCELRGLMGSAEGREQIDAMTCLPEPKEPKRRMKDPAVGQKAMF